MVVVGKSGGGSVEGPSREKVHVRHGAVACGGRGIVGVQSCA